MKQVGLVVFFGLLASVAVLGANTVTLTTETLTITDPTTNVRIPASNIVPAVRISLSTSVRGASGIPIRVRACLLPDAGWLTSGVEYTTQFAGNYTTAFTLYNDPEAPCDFFARFVFPVGGSVQINATITPIAVPTVPEVPYSSGQPSIVYGITAGSQATIASFVAQYTWNTISAEYYGYYAALSGYSIAFGLSEFPSWSANYQDMSIGAPKLAVGKRYFINLKIGGTGSPSGVNVSCIVSPRHPRTIFSANAGPQVVELFRGVSDYFGFNMVDSGTNPLNLTVRYNTVPGGYNNTLSVRFSSQKYPNDMALNGLVSSINVNSSLTLPVCFVDRKNNIFYMLMRPYAPSYFTIPNVADAYASLDAIRTQIMIEAYNTPNFNYVSELNPFDQIVMSNTINAVGQLHHLPNVANLLDTGAVLQWNKTGNGATTFIQTTLYSSGNFPNLCASVGTGNTFLKNAIPLCSSFEGVADMLVRNTAGNASYSIIDSLQLTQVGVGINFTLDTSVSRMIRGPSDPSVYPIVVQLQPWTVASTLEFRLYLQRASRCGDDSSTALRTIIGAGPYTPSQITLMCPTQTIYVRPGVSATLEARLLSTSTLVTLDLQNLIGQSFSYDLQPNQVTVFKYTKPAGASFNVTLSFNTTTVTAASLVTYVGNCASHVTYQSNAIVLSASSVSSDSYRGSGGISPFFMSDPDGFFKITAPATSVRATLTIGNVGTSICSADQNLVPSQCVGRIPWSLPKSGAYSRSSAEASIAAIIDGWNNTMPWGSQLNDLCYSRFLDQACRRFAPPCDESGYIVTPVCMEDCAAHTELACGGLSRAFKICTGVEQCVTRLPVAPISLPAPPATAIPPASQPMGQPMSQPTSPPASGAAPQGGSTSPTAAPSASDVPSSPPTDLNAPFDQNAPSETSPLPQAAPSSSGGLQPTSSNGVPTSSGSVPTQSGTPTPSPAGPSPSAGSTPSGSNVSAARSSFYNAPAIVLAILLSVVTLLF